MVTGGESQYGVDIFEPSSERPIVGAQCKLHRRSKMLRPAEVHLQSLSTASSGEHL